MALETIQILLVVLSACSVLSAAWLVLHARDVVLILRHILPIDPGEGRRLASFKTVCAIMTLFGFSFSAETYLFVRLAVS